MSSTSDNIDLVASLSEKLDQNGSLLLSTFDHLEEKVKSVGKERKVFLLEGARKTLEKLHLIDEASNLNEKMNDYQKQILKVKILAHYSLNLYSYCS